MLALDDPRWLTLRGERTSRPAEFLPVLAQLRDDPAPGSRALGPLAGHLWPQFDVEETTVAAFPYLVAALARIPAEHRAWALDHIGVITALVSEAGWLDPPEDVQAAYDRAVGEALPLALEALRAVESEDEILWVSAAIAALKGRSGLCNTLLGLSRHVGECPECGEEIDLREACHHW